MNELVRSAPATGPGVPPASGPTEAALRESEARYRDLFENANDVIYTLDLEGRLTSVNRRAEQALGYTREECLGCNVIELIPPEYHARMYEALERKLHGEGAPTVYELEVLCKNGNRLPLEVSSRLIVRDGKPVGIQGIARDISERRRAEQALRQSEERFRQLADNLPHGFIYQVEQAADARVRFSYVSGRIEDLLGIMPDEVLADPSVLYKLILDEDLPRVRAREAEAFLQHIPFDCQFRSRTRGGPLRWLHCRSAPRPLPDGSAIWDGIAVDITSQMLAEEALRENEERLRLVLDAGKIGAWDWDMLANQVVWSERTYEIHGLAPGKVGSRVEDLLALVHRDDRDRVAEAVQQAINEHRPFETEFRIARPDGELRWITTTGQAHYDDTGRPVRMLGATLDVTERRAAEEALKEADRRKDDFLAMLAHELRNPLAPIRNSVQVLRLIGLSDANLAQARDVIERQVGQMARLVDDLLDVSRISRGKILLRREPLDLVPLVRATVEDHRSLLEGSGLSLTVELVDRPLWARGDPTRLSQVVGNLLHNASKFTDAGGSVLVRLTGDEQAVELMVQDSGIGMSPDILGRLFEPFSQADRSIDRSRGGLGLGLALVKGLVEMHGGSVCASSAGFGKGSAFVVRLPLSRPEDTPQPRDSNYRREGQPVRILIIEDNRDAADSLRMVLQLLGYEVALAHSARPGLDLAQEFRPAIVLCDIGLPGGMDGHDVARAFRADAELCSALLVALSGYGQEEDQRKARQAGFDYHMTKPASLDELQRVLATRVP
jgi:PAS domain S-box-containing protein